MAEDKTVPPQLGETRGDVVARTLGVAAGLIPCIGPMVQIALNETIPNARMERIEAYLRHLSERIDRIRLEAALKTPEGLDLFEEGMWQAARALSDDRKQHVATLVASGMGAEDISGRQSRHFLRILNQLDDAQIIILCSYQSKYGTIGSPEATEFWEKHAETLGPFSREIGGDNADQRRAAHKDALERHLSSFGLLEVTREDLGTWDGAKTIGAEVEYGITHQGRDFLRFLGLSEE